MNRTESLFSLTLLVFGHIQYPVILKNGHLWTILDSTAQKTSLWAQ